MNLIAIITTSSLIGVLVLYLIWTTFRPIFQPEHLYVVFYESDRRVSRHFLKPKDGRIKVGETSYLIQPEQIYRSGRWNTGVIYFRRGTAAPIDFATMRLSATLSAADAHEQMENHIARDFWRAFSGELITTTTSFLILVVILVLGFGFTYYKLGGEIGKVREQQELMIAHFGIVIPEDKK